MIKDVLCVLVSALVTDGREIKELVLHKLEEVIEVGHLQRLDVLPTGHAEGKGFGIFAIHPPIDLDVILVENAIGLFKEDAAVFEELLDNVLSEVVEHQIHGPL